MPVSLRPEPYAERLGLGRPGERDADDDRFQCVQEPSAATRAMITSTSAATAATMTMVRLMRRL